MGKRRRREKPGAPTAIRPIETDEPSSGNLLWCLNSESGHVMWMQWLLPHCRLRLRDVSLTCKYAAELVQQASVVLHDTAYKKQMGEIIKMCNGVTPACTRSFVMKCHCTRAVWSDSMKRYLCPVVPFDDLEKHPAYPCTCERCDPQHDEYDDAQEAWVGLTHPDGL